METYNRKARPSEVKKALELTAMEMIALYSGNETTDAKDIEEFFSKKSDIITKKLWETEVYKKIEDKWRKADRGTFFDKVNYTDREKKFMRTDPDYLEWIGLTNLNYTGLKRVQNDFLKRMKKGTTTPEDDIIIKNADIKVWKTADEFFGEKKPYGKYPMITVDSIYYSVLDYGSDYYSEKWNCRFDYRLNKLGCYMEPHTKSTHVVDCDENKRKATILNKEKWVKDNPYCEEHVKDLR